MLSDIEIAQSTTLRPIAEIAAELGIQEEELELYGRYKAKINERAFARLAGKPDGKLVLVTAINPTPAGEGKTTTTAGLGQAMAKIGKNAVIALREPSLGPVFGIKGGAAGGGYAQVLPMEDINLHFTGDGQIWTCVPNWPSSFSEEYRQIFFFGKHCSVRRRMRMVRRIAFLLSYHSLGRDVLLFPYHSIKVRRRWLRTKL